MINAQIRGIKPDGYWTFVVDLNAHCSAEPPARHTWHAQFKKSFDKVFTQRLGVLRRRCAAEARSPAPAGVGVQRELRNHKR